MWTHGHFYWNELLTRDPAAAKAFYAETLGWSYAEMPMAEGVYHVAMDGDRPVGGIMKTPHDAGEGPDNQWCAYIAVDDIDRRVLAAADKGATVLREPFEVEGVGRIAILQDPTGAMVGWMTPSPSESP